MLKLYFKQENKIEETEYTKDMLISSMPVWIDLHDMTREEELFVEHMLKINVPSREEMHELELSSRLYNINDTVYMTTSLVTKVLEDDPEIHSVTFILHNDTLVTVRYCEPKSFARFKQDIHSQLFHKVNAKAIYGFLIDSIIERSADILWNVGEKIDIMTKDIFRTKNDINYKTKMAEIGHLGDLISKVTESLVTINRMVHFILQSPYAKIEGEIRTNLSIVADDIVALTDHANFLSNKITFLLDATLGMINIEQNNIIKIFSVAAVISMPPTLVASIYGMNFSVIPELGWKLGYPYAIFLMLFSAWLPFKYFKRKKWL